VRKTQVYCPVAQNPKLTYLWFSATAGSVEPFASAREASFPANT
jgi:hypothetical protein